MVYRQKVRSETIYIKKYELELKKEIKKNPFLKEDKIREEPEFFTIWIPPQARLPELKKHLNNDFKITVSNALSAIEEANSYWLKGASFANIFTNPDLNNQLLINVFKELDKLNWDFDNYNGDFFGEAYQFLVSNFASSLGKKGGEFYTPQSVVELLVELIKPLNGIVYDPCCGTGGMFVQSIKFMKAHADKDNRERDIQIFGQEINVYTWRLAKINLALRGIPANLGEAADTFRHDQHPALQIDYFLANPPFNQRTFYLDKQDPRYSLGIPPKKYGANLAWIEVMVSKLDKLKSNGSGAVVMVSNILFNNARQASEIRRKLLENNLLEAVISLPPNLFFEVNIDIYVLILRKGRKEENVLFLDARQLFIKQDANLNKFSVENIKEIVNVYEEFRKNQKSNHPKALILNSQEIQNNNKDCILLLKRFLIDKKLSLVKVEEMAQQIKVLFKEIEKLNQELTIIYNNLTEITKTLLNQKSAENIPFDLLTTIPNFNIFSPGAYSQILSNIFFTADLFFKQNCDTEIIIKDYFDLISGDTPSTKNPEYWENGKTKFLNQGSLLDIYYLHDEIIPAGWITEKAIQENKTPFTKKNSVLMTFMAGIDQNILRRIVWCQSSDYTFNQLVINFTSKGENNVEYKSATLFFALRNQNKKIISLLVGSRGTGGHMTHKEVRNLTMPWVSNPEVQEKLFNLLNNDLAKLIKEKQELIKEKQELIKEKQELIKEKLLQPNIKTHVKK